ncbi:MAG: CocE/NonD family hydrolase, partial [Myxococcota bacterium]
IADAPSVRIYVQQADVWLYLPDWPPPTEEQSLYLAAGRALLDRPNSERDSSSRFRYDPSDPTPSVAGPVLFPPAGQAENAALESRSDVLVFTGPALTQSIDVVGTPRAEIVCTAETPYADLFVRVCDVDPKGRSRNVVDGMLRLDNRIGETATSIELPLYPTAYRFRAGHRIRVLVAGGAFPRFARNLGTGQEWSTGMEMQPNTVRVLHDVTHVSRVILPVLKRDADG